jgi:hypothetical protein
MENLVDVPAGDVVTMAETHLKSALEEAGPEGADSDDYFTIAQA